MKNWIYLGFLLILPISTVSADPLKEATYKEPLREVSVITTADGFYPNKIIANKGERLRIFVTSTTVKNQCFLLERHDVFLAAEKGKVNEGEVLLDKSGRFKFYCPSHKQAIGFLTVVEKKNEDKNKEQLAIREIASEEERKPNYWLPRNYD